MLALGILAAGCGPRTPPGAPTTLAAPDAEGAGVRGVYVRHGARIETEARSVIGAARAIGATSIVIYGLGDLLGREDGEAAIARFVLEAHAAGLAEVGAPIADDVRLRAIVAYSGAHPEARFDLLITESEYWNACAPREDCFARFVGLIDAMRAAHGGTIGAYLGYPTEEEAREIAARVDRVYLDLSIADPARAFVHVHARGGPLADRWAVFERAGTPIRPILYADGEVDVRGWLAGRPIDVAERAVIDAAAHAGRAAPAGVQWFVLEAMPALGPR